MSAKQFTVILNTGDDGAKDSKPTSGGFHCLTSNVLVDTNVCETVGHLMRFVFSQEASWLQECSTLLARRIQSSEGGSVSAPPLSPESVLPLLHVTCCGQAVSLHTRIVPLAPMLMINIPTLRSTSSPSGTAVEDSVAGKRVKAGESSRSRQQSMKRSRSVGFAESEPRSKHDESLAGLSSASSSSPKELFFPIVVGGIVRLENPESRDKSHRWTVYVRTLFNEDVSELFERMTFLLDPSFQPCVVPTLTTPFEITRHGWGEFVVVAKAKLAHPATHTSGSSRASSDCDASESDDDDDDSDAKGSSKTANPQPLSSGTSSGADRWRPVTAGITVSPHKTRGRKRRASFEFNAFAFYPSAEQTKTGTEADEGKSNAALVPPSQPQYVSGPGEVELHHLLRFSPRPRIPHSLPPNGRPQERDEHMGYVLVNDPVVTEHHDELVVPYPTLQQQDAARRLNSALLYRYLLLRKNSRPRDRQVPLVHPLPNARPCGGCGGSTWLEVVQFGSNIEASDDEMCRVFLSELIASDQQTSSSLAETASKMTRSAYGANMTYFSEYHQQRYAKQDLPSGAQSGFKGQDYHSGNTHPRSAEQLSSKREPFAYYFGRLEGQRQTHLENLISEILGIANSSTLFVATPASTDQAWRTALETLLFNHGQQSTPGHRTTTSTSLTLSLAGSSLKQPPSPWADEGYIRPDQRIATMLRTADLDGLLKIRDELKQSIESMRGDMSRQRANVLNSLYQP